MRSQPDKGWRTPRWAVVYAGSFQEKSKKPPCRDYLEVPQFELALPCNGTWAPTFGMLTAMQEDGALIWAMHGTMSPGRRERALLMLRRQYHADLTDARAEVVALRQRLRHIDNALRDYTLDGKQE